MKRVVLGLVLIYSCFIERSLEASNFKYNDDNNSVFDGARKITHKEKYPRVLAQHGFVAQVALINYLRAIDGFKAEAEEKKLREEEAREREARTQRLLQASAKKTPNQRKFRSRRGRN